MARTEPHAALTPPHGAHTARAALLWLSAYVIVVVAPLFALLPGPGAGRGFPWDVSMALGYAAMSMFGVQFWLTARFKRPTPPVPPAFERLRCSGCHSIGGIGNPGSPLDGIGARMSAAEIRDWTLATGRAREEISARTAQRKSQAANDPELQALIDYLAASK